MLNFYPTCVMYLSNPNNSNRSENESSSTFLRDDFRLMKIIEEQLDTRWLNWMFIFLGNYHLGILLCHIAAVKGGKVFPESMSSPKMLLIVTLQSVIGADDTTF